jgi:hypothetical protein
LHEPIDTSSWNPKSGLRVRQESPLRKLVLSFTALAIAAAGMAAPAQGVQDWCQVLFNCKLTAITACHDASGYQACLDNIWAQCESNFGALCNS